GELLDDLAESRFFRHRRTGAGVLLPFAGLDQPKEEPTGGLLILKRKAIKGPLRRYPNGFSHPTRARVGIGGYRISFAQFPGFLQGVLQKRQHALIFAGLIEDALHQFRRIECESDFFRWLDDGAFQLETKHLAEKDLPGRQKSFDFLM